MFHDHLYTLGDVRIVQLYKARDLAFGISSLTAGIFFDLFVDLIEGVVRRVVLQHIEDESFFDGLLHRIDVEGFALAFGVQPSEELQRGRFWRCCEGKHRDIGLFAVAPDLVGDNVFHIVIFLIVSGERLGNGSHIFAGSGRVGFVDDHSEALVLEPSHAIDNVWEFLDRGGDDLGVAVERDRQISRIALIVHDTDQASFVFQSHDRFLQLPVYDHAVGHDHDVVKDDLVVRIVQRRQAVCQPGDGVCFPGASAVLDQVVL